MKKRRLPVNLLFSVTLAVILSLMSVILVYPSPVLGAPPAKPTHLVAASGDSSTVSLAWTNNAPSATLVQVWRKVLGQDDDYRYHDSVPITRTYYYESGLEPGTTYCYKVRVHSTTYGFSDFSNEASARTNNLAVAITSPNGGEEWKAGEVRDITWSSDAEGYTVTLSYKTDTIDWTEIATVPNTNAYAWTVPNVNSTHVRVKAYVFKPGGTATVSDQSNGEFTIKGKIMQVIPLLPLITKPAAPTGLALENPSGSTVILNWQDNSDNESGFKIWRETEDSSFMQIGTTDANTVSYTDTGLSGPGALVGECTYRVCAYNSAGNSNYSNEASIELMRVIELTPRPSKPFNLTAEAVSDNSIKLIWKNANPQDGIEIQRQESGGDFDKIAELAGVDNSYIDTGLSAGQRYTYRLRAFNNGDTPAARSYSLYSDEASAMIPAAPGTSPGASPGTSPGISPGTSMSDKTVLRFYISSGEYYVQEPYQTASRVQTMDTAPMIFGGRTLLPIRYVSEPLGAAVSWDATLDQVTVQLGDKHIALWINNGTARVNGAETPIDPANPEVTPIIIPPGRTMLPLRFIAENLGCRVEWNAELREAMVIYPK